MKNYFLKYTIISTFLSLFLLGNNIAAQELSSDNYRLKFSFKTVKNFDDSRTLNVQFIGTNKKDRKDRIPVYGAEVSFYNVLGEEEKLLGTSETSKEGVAEITLAKDQKYLQDEFGNINLISRFEGGENMRSMESELSVKNLHLKLNLSEIDSVKTVVVNAFTLDSLGMETPVENAPLIVSVEGMFSKMILAEDYIVGGEFEYEFPTDLPGDVNGDITVYAVIEDHDEFGDVIQKSTANWGNFNKEAKEDKYTLWSSLAPIWMYVVLSIMLIGVWANYIYTIINLYRIKKDSNKYSY